MKPAYWIACILILPSFVCKNVEIHTFQSRQLSFGKGEVLEYSANLGFFNVAKAQIKISDNQYQVNGKSCYKIDVFGQTSGAIDWVAKVDDNWGAFIDSASLVPHISYRDIKEGKYRKKEIIRYDHQTDVIEAKVINNKTGEFKDPVYYKSPDDIRDMIGGYMFLRALDYSGYSKGDTIALNAFFEDTFYNFRILYGGKEKVTTKAGKFRAIKLVPIMPDNKIFQGENSITVWLSDDGNKIPLKVKAKMFIGSAGTELVSYSGLKNELNIIGKR